MNEVVVILNADDLANAARLFELARRDVAQPEVSDQSLLLEIDQRGKLFLDRTLARSVKAAHAQVDNIERFDFEVSQVVMDSARELSRLQGRNPRGVITSHGADLSHNH